MDDKTLFIIIGISTSSLFAILGAVLMVLGVKRRKHKQEHCTLIVQAKCIRIESHTDEEGGTTYRPVFESTVNGREVEIQDNLWSSNLSIEEGETRSLKVNPDNPNEYYDANKKLGVDLFCFVGGIFLFTAIVFAVLMPVIANSTK